MFRRLTRPLHLLTFTLLLLSGLGAHAQMGVIKGRLLLNQVPIADETVVLKNAEGRIFNGTMTDEFGDFAFPHVPPGTYTVVGKFKDFEAEVECVVNPGEEVPVSLHCKKKTLFQWVPDAKPQREPAPIFTQTRIPAKSNGRALA
ncbi:MAG TPA: carboxypeptidase-like regulatory domain-containing protein [Bacteroidia bacterium]|nr:carboxypeptidase-like regulatory domain-containing protein [Bacteroidia bacterium]